MIKRVDSGGQIHLVTNIRKPRKWRRFEYLYSNGNLYIKTDYIPNNTSGIYLRAYCTQIAAGQVAIGRGTSENNYRYWINYTTNGISIGWNTATTFSYDYVNVWTEVWLNYMNSHTTKIDNTSRSISYSAIRTYNSPLYIFVCSNTLGTPTSPFKGRISNVKITDGTTLVHDFVPAEYNGLYGMWDLVEDRFYRNSGTGSFTVGPEVKNYDEIYEVRKTTSILPAGVELYDYILSSGALYIDTGYIPKGDFGVETKFQLTRLNGFQTIWGTMPTSSQITPRTGFHNYKTSKWMAGINNTTTFGTADTNLHTVKQEFANGTETIQLDGSQVYNYSPGTTALSSNTLSLCLFVRKLNDSITNYTAMKCYYFSINDGSKLVRNFIPCTYLGEPGMWDTVENKFYRNQGTGQFTLGNKITLKEYEYLLSTGTQWINTGVNGYMNHTYELDFLMNDTGDYRTWGVFGQSSYIGYNMSFTWSTNWAIRWESVSGNQRMINNIATKDTNRHLLKISNGAIYLDNISKGTSEGHNTNTVINYNLFLFTINPANTTPSTNSKCKIYNYKDIDINGNIIRNMIPCSYNGTLGLWDKVEWKFYANAGSGSFILGPEKVNGIYPVSYLHDRTIYEEPDGSKWLRISHHNDPSTRRFTSTDSFTTYVHTSDDLWFDVSWCNTFTTWELMVKQKTTSSATEQKFRWVLNHNPMSATFNDTKADNITYNTDPEYTTPGTKWGGLMKINSSNTYLCGNNGTSGNWCGATGCKVLYLGGLPGWNSSMVTTGYIDLYIRIT